MVQDKLDSVTRVGKPVVRRKKGDFSSRRSTEVVGVTEDEVRARDGDNLYILERIQTRETAGVIYRPLYFTMESRLRPGRTELRVGFGQYAPFWTPRVLQELIGQARVKGWIA